MSVDDKLNGFDEEFDKIKEETTRSKDPTQESTSIVIPELPRTQEIDPKKIVPYRERGKPISLSKEPEKAVKVGENGYLSDLIEEGDLLGSNEDIPTTGKNDLLQKLRKHKEEAIFDNYGKDLIKAYNYVKLEEYKEAEKIFEKIYDHYENTRKEQVPKKISELIEKIRALGRKQRGNGRKRWIDKEYLDRNIISSKISEEEAKRVKENYKKVEELKKTLNR